MTLTIAIIGAGMAGLAAGRRLRQAGAHVTLIDKSRGVGGRMATRRVDGLSFDHGAQYFRARSDGFRALLAQWQAGGHAGLWFDDAHVGLPGMTGPARALREGIELVTATTVTALARDGGGWTLHGAAGPLALAANGTFDAVILAVPAPQAVPLVASAGLAMPAIATAIYAPCWALMLAFAERQPVADQVTPDDDMIGWIARDSSKPGRASGTETIVVHGRGDWSRANLEDTADMAAAALLERFRRLTGSTATPTYCAAHRWRYALVETPVRGDGDTPFFWDATSGLGACGDWCVGARVEAAFESGDALAAAVLGR